MVRETVAGSLRYAPTVKLGTAVSCTVGRAIYKVEAKIVGVAVRLTDAPAAPRVALRVGVAIRETDSVCARNTVTEMVGVIVSWIVAGVMRVASTERVGVAIPLKFARAVSPALTVSVAVAVSERLAPVGVMTVASTVRVGDAIRLIFGRAVLSPLTVSVGVAESETCPANPPNRNVAVGVTIRLMEAGSVR